MAEYLVCSVMRFDTSVQYIMYTPYGAVYSVKLFYLHAGDAASSDFTYNRKQIPNLCQCDDPFSVWRLCVAVMAIDGRLPELSDVNLQNIVLGTVRAFHKCKMQYHNDGTAAQITANRRHRFINFFTGSPLMYYDVGPGDTLTVTAGGNTAHVCPIHTWLGQRATRDWVHVGHDTIIRMLSVYPQLVIIERPVISNLAAAVNDVDVFRRYRSLGDRVSKHMLLSHAVLKKPRGVGSVTKESPVTIVFKAQDSFVMFRGSTDVRLPTNALTSAANEDSYEQALTLLRHLPVAPSVVYMTQGLLRDIGFHVTAVPRTNAHTFEHTCPILNMRCTVFCSVAIRVITDSVNGYIDTNDRTPISFGVLPDTRPHDSVLDAYQRDNNVSRDVREERIDIGAHWPRTAMRRIRLGGTSARWNTVEFMFFVAKDVRSPLRTLTYKNLRELIDTNMRTPTVSPIIMFAFQELALANGVA